MPRVRFGSRSGQSIGFEGVVSRVRIWVQRSLFVCTRNAKEGAGTTRECSRKRCAFEIFSSSSRISLAGKFDETTRPLACHAAFWIYLRLKANLLNSSMKAPPRSCSLSRLSYRRSRQQWDSYRHVRQERSMHLLSSGGFAKNFRKEFGMPAIARVFPAR